MQISSRGMGINSQAKPQGFGTWLVRNWIVFFALVFGAYVWLPFLAPVLMHVGWFRPGEVIQSIYSTQCHQLPDRSFFLFGQKVTYSLPEIQAAWKNSLDPTVLRQFVGNPQMGWKVAWSDRMVAMYTSTWLFALLWWPLRKHIRTLPLWGLALFWLPMAIDGGTHFLSDLFSGIGGGFRYTNNWLVALTGQTMPQWFTTGNAIGSFNSWMRIITGVLFGLGLAWFILPIIEDSVQQFLRDREQINQR